MNVTEYLCDNWKLTFNDKSIVASVPGDITMDLYNAGIIENPYYGINHKELGWILKTDFEYSTMFDISEDLNESEQVMLILDSVDVFSEIYINEHFVGKTENMFLQYSFNIKPFLRERGNELKIKMISTANIMETIDDEGFFGTFNVKRLFIRKAQCHFGWDWAPDMPGYGLCGKVYLVGTVKNHIDNTHYRAHKNGSVSIFANLNYSTRPHFDSDGKMVMDDENCRDDKLRFVLATEPDVSVDEAKCLEKIVTVTGSVNFVNFALKSPELWWPSGYGEHPLYEYKVQLLRGGEVVDEKTDHLAFREVKLIEEPVDGDTIGYKLNINGKDVFVKGSNWVPAECFIGCIKDEKYQKLISQAVEANFNMLRVWGGGIYEKDVFYDICDRMGIMVWQDLMFACGDIPEENQEFLSNCQKEIEYQVKRLRNHPSLVYWCGGNEKTGSYGLKVSRGEFFINIFLRGIVNNLDGTRPYACQSPCSLTDVGNDRTSGESHAGSFEACLSKGVHNYREEVSKTAVPFISECAIMGPGSLESLKKIFPDDKLWPINEYWDDRLMDNPYSEILMPFSKRQEHYATELYGKCDTVGQFIAKGMTVHAEAMRAEIEYARARKGKCWGFMNWMYSDIWPSATWSVVDYYCEPKQVYYQMKRSYAPLLLTFVQRRGGITELTVVNDLPKNAALELTYGEKTFNGEVVWSHTAKIEVAENGVYRLPVDIRNASDTYLFVSADFDGEHLSSLYSPNMWCRNVFESDYSYTVQYADGVAKVDITANKFAKGVTLRLPDNYKYTFSDNYIDIEAGGESTVYIYGAEVADIEALTVTDFASET